MSDAPVSIESFSPDYATARERFRQAVTELGWELRSHPIAAAGPDGLELTRDVAFSPAGDSNRTLLLSSGLHGVEGFFGSAVQIGLLQQWKSSPPPVRCVLVHPVNPFGMAWLRRFDERNVDLNRNFLKKGETYLGAPEGFAELDSFLHPRRPPSFDFFYTRAVGKILRHGMKKLKQCIAEGQYEYPQGLFFGGSEPSPANLWWREHIRDWIAGSERVAHLDFHTGLGPSGTYKLLLDYPINDAERQQLSAWFGPNSFEAFDANGVAYETRGGIGRWCVGEKMVPEYVFACAEFGTYPPVRVLAGLRQENQAHHWGQPNNRSTRQVKTWLKELFCPASPKWQQQVLAEGYKIVNQAIAGLQGP